MGISRDEWLRALGDAAAPPDPDALTVKEIAAQFGIPERSALRHAGELVKEGRAVRTRKHSGVRLVAAYRLVVQKGKRAA